MPKMSIQRVRAMRKKQAAALKKRQDRAKALKAKREKAKAKKAPAPKKKAAAPKKKAPTKTAAVKRREPVKAAPPKVGTIPRGRGTRVSESIKKRMEAAQAEAQQASLMTPREAEGKAEDFGGKQAPITKEQTTPSKEPQSTEDLLRQYNESQGAKDFGLSVTFDEETGEYVEDVSAFGFEGDQAT